MKWDSKTLLLKLKDQEERSGERFARFSRLPLATGRESIIATMVQTFARGLFVGVFSILLYISLGMFTGLIVSVRMNVAPAFWSLGGAGVGVFLNVLVRSVYRARISRGPSR